MKQPKVTFPATGAASSPDVAAAWTSGVEAAQSWWREKLHTLVTSLAGGERGFAACRRNGRCEREPQKTLEELLEKIGMLECRADDTGEPVVFPASRQLMVLAELLKTPDFQPIHIRRAELQALTAGIRSMQTHARDACSTIDRLGKLNYQDLRYGDIGPAITSLCTIRVALEELLK